MATSQQRTLGVKTDSLRAIHWLAVLCAAVSGVIHLFLGANGVTGSQYISFELGVSFLLAGLGFFGAIALVLLDVRRRAVYTLGVPFTVIQLVLWYYFNFAVGPKSFPAEVGTMGAADKVAQVLLIAILVALLRSE